MKRIIIYVLILGVLLFVPLHGNDVGKLRPVEVVLLYRQGESVVIQTDTGDVGIGIDVDQALQNLKDTTPGYIYLDTAEYLLMTEQTQQDAEALREVFHKSLQLCLAEPGVDLELTARFLPAHGPFPKLKDWNPGDKLPFLTITGNRLRLL